MISPINLKNKKAILLEETLKIVLAVSCIALLVIFAIKLYGIFSTANELKQAQASLDAIFGKAQVLQENQETAYIVTAPKDWYIWLFESSEDSIEICGSNLCLCICKASANNANIGSICKKSGTCKASTINLKIQSTLSIHYLSLTKLPAVIHLKKSENIVYLSGDEDYSSKNLADKLASDYQDTIIAATDNTGDDDSKKQVINDLQNLIIQNLGDQIFWYFIINKNEKKVLELKPKNSNTEEYTIAYSMMMQSTPNTASFSKENNNYEIKIWTAK